jgi:SNF2 family DNA or RNA helicase
MLRENWIKEFKKFGKSPLRLCKGKNIHDFVAWARGRFDVLITSYELMSKWVKHIHDEGHLLDFVVFDEAHYLKNIQAQRTKQLLGVEANGKHSLTQWAGASWHVTGTPMANDPLDIYTFLRFAKAFDVNSAEFVKSFFDVRLTTYGARHSTKESMLPTLQQLIRNNSIRRTHEDVGMQLPPIWIQETLIEGDTIELDKLVAGYPHLEEAIIEAIETGDISALDAAHIATVRRLVGKTKAAPYASLLKTELDAQPTKRVVFCVHTEPLLYVDNYLKKYGYGVVKLYGDMNDRDRQRAVERFMTDDSIHVIVANIRVAGVGLTLTSSCEIDMLESDWSPAGNAQAIKRVHRYGQDKSVRGRFITLAGSIDEMVNHIVAEKTAAIMQIEGVSTASIMLDKSA